MAARVAMASAALLLSACAVTTAVWDDDKVKAPQNLARVQTGLPAYVFFRELDGVSRVGDDLDAWRGTGLFRSVVQTTSFEPVKNGVFILVDCDLNYRRDNGFVLMSMLTLFIFPLINEEVVNSCKLSYYQDAVLLGKTTANLSYRRLENGFGLIPLWLMADKQNKTIAQDAAGIRVANLLKAVGK
jgi:hypothetical protein